MVTVFNLLRSNDLIWPYIINNYVKGKAPFPFDLLYWNSDATRLPAANYSFDLRNCYLDNKLTKGGLTIGKYADRSGNRSRYRSTIWPRREDHIAPAGRCCSAATIFRRPGALRAGRAPAISPAW